MTRLLERLAFVARRHYVAVFLVSIVLSIGAVLGLRTLRLETDVLALLPPNDPVVDTFRTTLGQFGSVDMLLVAVRIPEGVPVDPYLAFVDELVPRLEALPEIEYVDAQIGDLETLLADLLPRSLLFLDETTRAEVETRLSEVGIARRAEEIRRLASTPQAMALEHLTQLDPYGLAETLLGQLRGSRGSIAIDWQSGYYLSGDRRLLLVLAKPVKPAQDVEFDAQLVAQVDTAVAEAKATWPEIVGPDSGLEQPPEVVLGGGYLIALDDATIIKKDVVVNIVTSLPTVLVLFLIAFRRLDTMAYAWIPLVVGTLWTFGVASMVMSSLSSATAGAAALLLGLAIDFVIVLYGRYVEERQAGATLDQALHVMCTSTGRAVVAGALTTAVTFLAFFATDFRGLREMGFMAGVGIIVCLLAVMVLMPAMLAFADDLRARRAARRHQEGEVVEPPKLYVAGFGSDRLVAWSLLYPRVVVVAGLVLTVVLGFYATKIGFEDSIQNMRPKNNRGILVQDEVARHFGSGFEQMMLVVTAPTVDEALAKTEQAAARAQGLVEQGVLTGASAISSVLPSPTRQQANLDWLAAGRAAGTLDPAVVRARMVAALSAQGLRPEAFTAGLDRADEALSVRAPITLADLQADAKGARFVERYVRETPQGWKSVVYLYPPPKVWKRQAPPEVTRMANELGPQVALTGVNVVSQRLRSMVRRDATVAALLGTLGLLVLLAVEFRSTRDVLLSLVPFGLGLVWMIGTMAALGMKLSFFNVFVITMIIGIGVDYGIHVVHRVRDAHFRGGDVAVLAGETAKAVTLAGITTIVGFGSLATSGYPGIQSMGWVAVIGTTAAWLSALTVLPALQILLQRRREARGEE
jgi:predicted RND superfamily exporter protein